ncbi:MAG TPA: TlpA disulfide reductase family protein [Opitutus sp.]|nr:TlpA disulfide reductase family protein [Opitutus sp.]
MRRATRGGIIHAVVRRATISLLALATFARAQIAVGDAFPSLADAELTGGELPAIEGKVVLVDFWASWCAPCKASFPAMAKLHADYAARGLAIVAVSVDEKAASYAGFLKRMKPPFATLRDERHKLVRAVNLPAMPTSYLLGRDGRVRFVHRGFHGASSEEELRKNIEALLAENS